MADKAAVFGSVNQTAMTQGAPLVGPMNGKLGIYAAEAARNLFLPIHCFIPSI